MIEFKIGDDHVPEIKLCGDLETISTESVMFVNSVYNALLCTHKASAERFKNIFSITFLAAADVIFRENQIKSGSICTISVPRKGDGGNGN